MHPMPFFSPVLCTDVGICDIRSGEDQERVNILLPHWKKGGQGSQSLSRGAPGYVHSEPLEPTTLSTVHARGSNGFLVVC